MATGNYRCVASWEYHDSPTIRKVFVRLLQVFFGKLGATFVLAVNGVESIGVDDGRGESGGLEWTASRLRMLQYVCHGDEALSSGLGKLVLL